MSTEIHPNLPEAPRAKVLRLIAPTKEATSQPFVDVLEGWLECAKTGRLSSLVVAGVVDGDAESQYEGSPLEAIAVIELAKAHVMETMGEE